MQLGTADYAAAVRIPYKTYKPEIWDDLRKWGELSGAGADDPVALFLQVNPQLVGLLREAEEKLVEYFGPQTLVRRSLLQEEDEIPTLFLIACVRQPSRAALEIMDRLDEEWWFAQLDRSQGLVQLNFEHRSV